MVAKRLSPAWLMLGPRLFFLGLFLWSLPERAPHLDDAWLGEQAFRLAEEGVVHSHLFGNFRDWGDRLWVHHKLFLPQGAWVIEHWGWSLAGLKSVSLPWLAATLGLLALHVRRERARFSPWAAAWVPLLFFAHPKVMDYGYTFRPELCLTAIGLGSYLLLNKALEKDSLWTWIGSAVLAGLGVLVHLNGLMFVAGAGALCLTEGRWRRGLQYLVISLGVSSFYLLEAWQADALVELVAQFQNDPSLDASDFQALGWLGKLLREPQRWIRHGEEVLTTTLLVVALGASWAVLRGTHRRLLFFLLGSALALAVLGQSKTPKYLIPLLPYVFLTIGAGLGALRERGPRARRVVFLLLLAYASIAGARSLRYFSDSLDVAQRHAELLVPVPVDSATLVDLTFVFDEIGSRDLRGLWSYRIEAESRGEPFELSWALAAAGRDEVDFIVLDRKRALPRRMASQWDAQAFPGWKEIPSGKDSLLLVRRVEE